VQAPDSALALSYGAPGRPLVWPGRFVFGANHPVQDENDSLKPGPTLDPDPAGCAMARSLSSGDCARMSPLFETSFRKRQLNVRTGGGYFFSPFISALRDVLGSPTGAPPSP